MIRADFLLTVALAATSLLAAPPAQAGIEIPPAGTILTYRCDGPEAKEYVDTIAWVKDGALRIEGTLNGRPFWVEEPVYTFGLTLFRERESSSGSGRYTQSFDIDNLEDFGKLQPGATFEGSVSERDQHGRYGWGYDIRVGQPETIDHPLRGKIEVIPAVEKRWAYKGSYSSEMTAFYEKETGLFLRWHYRDAEGEETCDLTKIE